MRNLTITREKSFVGCLGRAKVFIEDHTYIETTINNIPCRKLGDLKNGETKTFLISEQAAKIFVIVDNISKNFCNDLFQIPAGEFDVSLSGRHKFNLFKGNPFRFNGPATPEMIENRKQGSSKPLLIFIPIFIIAAICGFAAARHFTSGITENISTKTKEYSSKGIILTLPTTFKETDIEQYTVCFASNEAAVFALKEEFSLAENFEDYTVEEYGNLVKKNNKFDDSIILKKQGQIPYFEYESTNSQTNETYVYLTYFYKTSDAFWTVQFTTAKENSAKYRPLFSDWAKSVSFDKK